METGMESLGEDWTHIERLLPAQWEAKARELGAFKRGRAIADARTLLRLLLIHLTDGCALRKTAVKASAGGLVSVSDVAILKRLRVGCGPLYTCIAAISRCVRAAICRHTWRRT